LFTQTQGGANPIVSFCVEVYDVPPSGSAGSLKDLDVVGATPSWTPKDLGGAAYIPPTDPSTGGNWPLGTAETSFAFAFSQTAVTIPAGDRVGLRIWMKSNQNSPIAVMYDNPSYASQVQLNSQ
jgi:hypothetical protein